MLYACSNGSFTEFLVFLAELDPNTKRFKRMLNYLNTANSVVYTNRSSFFVFWVFLTSVCSFKRLQKVCVRARARVCVYVCVCAGTFVLTRSCVSLFFAL